MMFTPTFLPHSSPIIHRPVVKEVVERKYLLNKDSLSFCVYLSPFHPCPLAMMFFACARGGRGERERSPFGMPPERPRSRHAGPRPTIAPKAEQVYDCAPGALASSRPSASSPVPALFASSACQNTSASSACPHVPASFACLGVPALLNASASAPVPALSACPHAPPTRHVCAGSNISAKAEQPSDRAPAGHQTRNVKGGKMGKAQMPKIGTGMFGRNEHDKDLKPRRASVCCGDSSGGPSDADRPARQGDLPGRCCQQDYRSGESGTSEPVRMVGCRQGDAGGFPQPRGGANNNPLAEKGPGLGEVLSSSAGCKAACPRPTNARSIQNSHMGTGLAPHGPTGAESISPPCEGRMGSVVAHGVEQPQQEGGCEA